ncbi:hypothetical protein I79_019434 [Cricetulus griseus]|uniref:Uncharacterized protein n=1 Tax=Cricetulus griseus TaxID=10029 RepID=G3I7E6_CRIGR|nr:hypothetical protein I79_019434 [Cricetulus griseus]
MATQLSTCRTQDYNQEAGWYHWTFSFPKSRETAARGTGMMQVGRLYLNSPVPVFVTAAEGAILRTYWGIVPLNIFNLPNC